MRIDEGNMDANMDANTVISAQNLIVSYGSRTIVKDVSFTIKNGEFVGLLGANGAGKTTLFRAIMGLIPVSYTHLTLPTN